MPIEYTMKPVLSGHLIKDKTKVLMEKGSPMMIESIAEHFSILFTCIKQ